MSLLFAVDDNAREFAIALTLRGNAPMGPGTYPCSAVNAGNRVNEAEILQFDQRFTSTSCTVTIDQFTTIAGARIITGSYAIEGATNASSATVHSSTGTFFVHL